LTDIERVAGSFRDPAGFVFVRQGAVYRAIAPAAAPDFLAFLQSPLFARLADQGSVVETRVLERDQWPIDHSADGAVVQHATIPFISYPYEWPFALLKAAALLHLDIQIESLERGYSLSDASAYNIQFNGPRPVFIDALSFRPYVDGEV
jgi:hypothetical protein